MPFGVRFKPGTAAATCNSGLVHPNNLSGTGHNSWSFSQTINWSFSEVEPGDFVADVGSENRGYCGGTSSVWQLMYWFRGESQTDEEECANERLRKRRWPDHTRGGQHQTGQYRTGNIQQQNGMVENIVHGLDYRLLKKSAEKKIVSKKKVQQWNQKYSVVINDNWKGNIGTSFFSRSMKNTSVSGTWQPLTVFFFYISKHMHDLYTSLSITYCVIYIAQR